MMADAMVLPTSVPIPVINNFMDFILNKGKKTHHKDGLILFFFEFIDYFSHFFGIFPIKMMHPPFKREADVKY